MILSAQSIRKLCTTPHTYASRAMVNPFNERTVDKGKTFGLSAAGYDVRVTLKMGTMLRFSAPQQFELSGGPVYHPGHTFALAGTMERFAMPKDVLGVVHDKSSWARRGLTVQNTIIEPGWRGYLTLELVYHGDHELIVCEGDPIAQIVFHRLDEITEQPYKGKYQDQLRGPQEAIEETP